MSEAALGRIIDLKEVKMSKDWLEKRTALAGLEYILFVSLTVRDTAGKLTRGLRWSSASMQQEAP